MNMENVSFEFDPSYDPEKLSNNTESERSKESSLASPLPAVTHIDIPGYTFDNSSNPFAWDANPQKPLAPIAKAIGSALERSHNMRTALVRGIQSGHHTMPRDKLLAFILKQGHDAYISQEDKLELYAKEYDGGAVGDIMEGFHMYKPKSDETPQLPIDIWMIFNKNDFENIEYTHPRHNTIARDKWRPTTTSPSLVGLLVVN